MTEPKVTEKHRRIVAEIIGTYPEYESEPWVATGVLQPGDYDWPYDEGRVPVDELAQAIARAEAREETMTEPKIKTLFLYEDTDQGTCFFELEGDYSHLDGVWINSTDSTNAQCEELSSLLLIDKEPYFKLPKLEQPTRDWTHFVKCGFLA